MGRKSIGKNYFYNLAYEVLTVLVPLVTTPYVSRVLGAEGIGVYSFTYSIVTYFALIAALGTTVYARREIAYCQDDKRKRSIVFFEVLAFRMFTTVLCLSAYAIYIMTVDYKIIGLVQSFYVLAVVLDINWFFQGMENFGTVVLRNTVVKFVNVAFIFAFVKSSDDLIIYIFGLAFLPLIGNAVTWGLIGKYIEKVPIKSLHPLRHFKGAFSLFIPTIAAQVYLLLDKTMLGLFTITNIENGYYEQAQKIIKICWTFVTSFATVMSPRIAYVYATKNREQLNNYMKNSFSVVWMIASPIAFGMAAISANIVPWFFGKGFEKVEYLLVIFAWIVFPIGISSVTGNQFLVATKKQRGYTVSIFVGAAVNFCLNLFLIPRFYSIGAAVASVIAELMIALVQIVYVSFIIKEIRLSDILMTSIKYLFSGMIMFIVVRYSSFLMESSFSSTLVLVGEGAVLYMVLLVIMRDALVISGAKKAYAYLFHK